MMSRVQRVMCRCLADTKQFWAILAVLAGFGGAAEAFPLGDSFTVSGTNFPTTFSAGAPLTFGTNPQGVPNTNGLVLVTQALGDLKGDGGDVLDFSFIFTNPVGLDLSSGFQVNISGIGNPVGALLFDAFLQANFGNSGSTGFIDVFPAVISSQSADGLDLSFSTGTVSWIDLLQSVSPGATVPDSIQVNFLADVDVPEPVTIMLFLAGGAAMMFFRRRALTLEPGAYC